MATAAKTERENNIRLLEARVESFKELLHSVENDDQPINFRRIKSQLAKLETDYDKFIRSHNIYRNLAKLDGEELETDNTMFRKWYQEHDQLTDEAAELVDEATSQAPLKPQEKTQRAKNEITIMKSSIEKQIESIQNTLDGDETTNNASLKWLTTEIDSVQSKLNTDLVEKYSMLEHLIPDQLTEQFNQRMSFTDEKMSFVFSLRKKVSCQLNKLASQTTGGHPSSPAGGVSTTSTGNLHYKKRDFPSFSGNLEDYPTFRKRWRVTVAPHFNNEHQLDQILISVPDKDRTELKCCTEMGQVWDILDNRYGRRDVAALHFIDKFKLLELSEPTDHHKFVKLYESWNTTKFNLTEIDRLDTLKELQSMRETRRKMPDRMAEEYAKARNQKESLPGISEWKILEEFMEDQIKISRQRVADSEGNETTSSSEITCRKCRLPGHYARNCTESRGGKDTSPRAGVGYLNTINIKDRQRYDADRAKWGKCPSCKSPGHNWNRRDGTVASDKLFSCQRFVEELSIEDRVQLLQSCGGCARCTSWTHSRDTCTIRISCGYKGADGTICNSNKHHKLLHGSHSSFVNVLQAQTPANKFLSGSLNSINSDSQSLQYPGTDQSKPLVLLQLQVIPFVGGIGLVMFDTGSTISLISEEFARSLGLKGHKIKQLVQVAGHEVEVWDTVSYVAKLRDKSGTVHSVVCYEIPNITGEVDRVNVKPVLHLYEELTEDLVRRPAGKVDFLLGNNYAGLHPTVADEDRRGNLRLLRSKFSSGLLLDGSHELLSSKPVLINAVAYKISRADINPAVVSEPVHQINHIQMPKKQGKIHIDGISTTLPNFFEAEELSVHNPRRCSSCSGCKKCSDRAQDMTRREAQELLLIKENMSVQNDRIHVKYPMIKDPCVLTNNRSQVERMQTSLEKKLTKHDQTETYNTCFQQFLSSGVMREVSEDELASWSGGVNFVSHHGVEKDSVSTPLRIVVNSSLNNNNKGHSYNSVLAKGPNSLANLYSVLITFRTYTRIIVWDIKKAYNTLLTGDIEMYYRLLVWRWGDPSTKWKVFGLTRVHYGDRPAAAVLECGKELIAELGTEIDPVTAGKSIEASYVDDSCTGGTDEELDKMVGNVTKLDNGDIEYDGTLSQIYGRLGVGIKCIVRSGERDPDIAKRLGGKFLGHRWDPTEDLITFNLTVNLHGKKNGVKMGPDLTVEELSSPDEITLTQRKVLQFVAQYYDPMGLISPILVRLKILLKKTLALTELTWDSPLPVIARTEWIKVLHDLTLMPAITFPRSTKPVNAVKPPWLVGFWDGADPAFAGVIYLRWELSDGSVAVNLLTSKARVTAKKGVTTPRSELNGLVTLCRLVTAVLEGMTESPSKITLAGDSRCTISATECMTNTLAPYFCNRVGEVLDDHIGKWKERDDNIEVEDLQYTPGEENPADLSTRGEATYSDVINNSRWQQGPSWLKLPRDQWMMNREFIMTVPETEKRLKVFSIQAQGENRSRLESILFYSDNLKKVKGIMARVIRATLLKDRLSVFLPLSELDYRRATFVMKKIAMSDTHKEIQDKKMITLAPFQMKGLYHTRGRLRHGLQAALGIGELLLLTIKNRLAYLIMMESHCQDHREIQDTLWRSRSQVWITKGRLLAKKIVKSCLYCRKKSKILLSQQMAELPPSCTQVARPWTHICIDLAGPIKVRSMVNSRAHMKAWPCIFTCMNTGAVTILPMHTYGAAALLLVWETFTSTRGVPKLVYSDQGSQLTKGASYVTWTEKEDPSNWAWGEVKAIASQQNTVWRFCPAGSQFRNGRAEQRVRALKETLSQDTNQQFIRQFRQIDSRVEVLRDSVATSTADITLNFAELTCLLARVSNIHNDRPLGVKKEYTDDDIYIAITPNQILLGKTSTTPLSNQQYDQMGDKLSDRLAYIEEIERAWWGMWYRQVFSSLLPYHDQGASEVRGNLTVGDICLVFYDSKVGKGDYRLSIVRQIHPDEHGVVREVTVGMRPRDSREKSLPYRSKELTSLRTTIQRLVKLDIVK